MGKGEIKQMLGKYKGNKESNYLEKTWKPIVAGIIVIIAGIISVLFGSASFALLVTCTSAWSDVGWFLPFGLFTLICGALAIRAGIYALKRMKWGWVLAASIYAGFGILGIPAIILTVLSKGEFE